MEKKTLGSFLSALRRAQGLTQQEVADRLAVSNKAVSRWERDEAMPDILLLPAIADLFASYCPDADVNLLSGGQPVYYYMISAE